MTDHEEIMAAERVMEALGRRPKTEAEYIRECEVGQVIPVDCFLQTKLEVGKKMRVPIMEPSMAEWLKPPVVTSSSRISHRTFERTECGWVRID